MWKNKTVFFHLCTPVLKLKWFQKRNRFYLFILFIYIHYLKFISLLFFFYILSIDVYVLDHRCKKNSNSKVVSYTYMYIHSLDAAQISNCILYTHIDRWQRFNGALWWQIYDVGWIDSSTKATRILEKIKWKSQFWEKLGRSNLKHGLPKGFFFFVVVKMKSKS